MLVGVGAALVVYLAVTWCLTRTERPTTVARRVDPIRAPAIQPSVPSTLRSVPKQSKIRRELSFATLGLGSRQDVPVPTRTACFLDLEKLPEEFVARTPFRSKAAMTSFVSDHRVEISVLLASITQVLSPALREFRTCARKADVLEQTPLRTEWNLEVTRDRWVLSDGRVATRQGRSAPPEKLVPCLAILFSGKYRWSRTTEDERLFDYSGPFLYYVDFDPNN
jgi:hypothetical protein